MTTYNTGNPIGSTDARDLYDNAQNLDNFANGTASSYTDRLGVSRRSLAGIDSAADNVLNAIGYAVPVAYAGGISLTLTSQTVDYSGVVYAPKSSALPFTTTSWGNDSSKFRAIQVADAALITYTAQGTGTIPRDAESGLGDFVSVKNYGALGDGVKNDYSDLAKACSDRKFPFVPHGTYYVTSLDGLHGLWGEGVLLYDGVTLQLPGYPGRPDNFVIDTFTRYARAWINKPLFIVGDSITEGSNSSDFKKNNYASIIRSAWQRRYDNKNFGFANFNTLYQPNDYAAHRLSTSGFDQIYPLQLSYFGGTAVRSVTQNDFIQMEFVGKDAVVVYEQDAVNGAVLEVSLDGAVVGSIDTKAASQDFIGSSLTKASFSVPIVSGRYGRHTIKLKNTQNKTATLCGVVYLDSSSPNATAWNCGVSSISLCDIPDDLVDLYARTSGMSVLSLGVNDDLTGKDISTFRAKLSRYLAGVVAVKGACIVNDFIFSKPESNPFKKALRDYAYAFGFPYIDFARLWLGGVDQNKFLNYLAADSVHPTDYGHESIGNEILRVMGLPYGKQSQAVTQQTPTLLNGWSSLGSGYAEVSAYRDDQTGQVTLNGVIVNAAAKDAYSTLFVLPEGFRPASNVGTLIFPVILNHALGEIEIATDGTVRLGATATAANQFISVCGVSFFAG